MTKLCGECGDDVIELEYDIVFIEDALIVVCDWCMYGRWNHE